MQQSRLVLQGTQGNEPHRRSGHGLADRCGVGSVVLLAAHVGFDISRRHQPRVMAKLDQLARPVMRRTAGLEPDNAGRQRIEELQ